jgi:hypothetical protein
MVYFRKSGRILVVEIPVNQRGSFAGDVPIGRISVAEKV